ncbi:hypothetical protein AB0E04_42295 [Streptomyces sp. NPDC048251]|uniref:hypothetical protein n=1 Tax=Streptomyces sp. NPDC048251 TaxID=3154501 RepID=UPI00342B71F7
MNGLLGELGKRLLDSWMSRLALPGLLYIATVAVAVLAGQADALDARVVLAGLDRWAAALGAAPVISQIGAAAGVALASLAAGLAVRAAAPLVEACWTGHWPGWARRLEAHRIAAREAEWERAHREFVALRNIGEDGRTPEEERELARWAEARNGIALARPSRPTHMGDRVAAVETRVHHEYGIDLVSAWPRLWLVLTDAERGEVVAARGLFDAKVVQAAWACGYLLLALVWWPAAVVGLVVGASAWWDGRTAITEYADLVESVVDLRRRELAVAAGVLGEGATWEDGTGRALGRLFRKGA